MIQDNMHNWPAKQYETQALNENVWFLEKKGLNEQIKQLQARVNGLQNINTDLLNRNRMLQYCLRQLKGEKNENKPEVNSEIRMPQRRSKPNKNHISKILQSLGVKNLLENIQKDIELRGPTDSIQFQHKVDANKEKDRGLIATKSSDYKEIGQPNSQNSHQDGVRDLAFINDKDILVSVSEDCTMKLWNLKTQPNFSCLGTIREHSGPIFTITQGENYLFSGGMEGVIRVWNFQNVVQKKDVTKRCCIGNWTNSDQEKLEPIWQLLYSPQYKILFSTSSEVSIKSYSLEKDQDQVNGIFKRSYQYESKAQSFKGDQQIPTSICIHNGSLVAGYVTSHSLAHFDLETGKITNDLKIPSIGQVSTNKYTYQYFRIISHPNLLIGAFEDKMVRLFDKNKMTSAFKAHDDSVTSVATTSNLNQFFTCSHDGYVKVWDLRKLQPISSFNSHSKKYDQSVHCIATSSNFKAASGGADSIIKVYSTTG